MANEVVIISGIKETTAALKKFDKDAARRLNKVINDELRLAEGNAKEQIPDKPPMSGWRTTPAKNPRKTTRGGEGWPSWDPQAIRQGIVKTRSEGRVRSDYTTSAGALFNKTASGVIFEVAGRRTPGQGTGRKMIGNLNDRFRKASRGIWAVIDRDHHRIYANIRSAMDDAQKTLQANLNKDKKG
jgi:hypothetical protein